MYASLTVEVGGGENPCVPNQSLQEKKSINFENWVKNKDFFV